MAGGNDDMKDIMLKADHIKREVKIFIILLLVAFGINVYAIITYQTDWSELATQIHIIFALALVMYGISIMVRLLRFAIFKLFKKNE